MTTIRTSRIVLIHALSLSLAPIKMAFDQHWPEAELVNILDDSLSLDLIRAQTISDDMTRRFVTLGEYAHSIGADAILFTCSAFGKAIDIVKQNLDIPVLKPNEAMFEEALQMGGKMGMLTTFGPSLPSMEAEFKDTATDLALPSSLTTILVDQAMAMLSEGDSAGHNQALQQAAALHFANFDLIMMAQFSTAQASASVSEVFNGTVLTSPKSAVLKLKRILFPDTV